MTSVGTVSGTTFAIKNGAPRLTRTPKLEFVDDGPGKPVGICRAIGRQPILAFGNSDGDWPMLQWTEAGTGPRYMALIRHTDAVREYAYDRQSKVGKLDKAWDDAVVKGWTVVDMKRDWKKVSLRRAPMTCVASLPPISGSASRPAIRFASRPGGR